MSARPPLVTLSYPSLAPAPISGSPVDFWGRLVVTLILLCWAASLVIGFQAALATLTIGGFAMAIVGVVRPVIGLLGIGMLSTLEPLMKSLIFSTGGLWRWHTFDYWLLLVALTFVWLLLDLKDARDRLVLMFAVLMGLEVLISPDWYHGLHDVAGVVGLFGLVVYFARVAGDAAAWRWLGLVCGTMGAVWGVTFVSQQATLSSINPNAWAYVPLTGLFGICLAFPLARSWQRSEVILAMLASANYTLVFLSGSRGTLLTATGCALFLLFLTGRARSRWVVTLAAALVALAIVTQFTELQSSAMTRINLLLDPRHSLASRTSGRSLLLVDGWHMFLDHPLGVGTGGFAITRVSSAGTTAQMNAHAGWIKILAENGVPGIALMGAYLLSFAVAGWRSRHRDALLLGLLVTLALGLGFVSTEYQNKGLWFLAAGVTVLLRPSSILFRRAGRLA